MARKKPSIPDAEIPNAEIPSPDPSPLDPDLIAAWRQMAGQLNLGLFLHVNGILVFVSEIILRIAGLTREEMIGTPFWNWVHPEDRIMVADRAAARLRGEEVPDTYCFRALHKNGEVLWLELRATPIEYKGQTAIMGYVVDVTERRKAEEALKEEARQQKQDLEGIREVLHKAIMSSPLPVTLVSLDDGRLVEVNRAFEDSTGWSREEALGRTTAELDMWEDPRDRGTLLERLRKDGWVRNLEIDFRARDGRIIKCLYTGEVVRLDGREAVLAISADITPLKEAMARLAESETRYRQLVEGAPVGIGVMDLETGLVVSVNDRLCEYLGYKAEELVGMSPADFFDREGRRDFLRRKAAMQEGTSEGFTSENRFITRDGQIRWAIISANMVPGKAGQPFMSRAIITDITARRRAEAELAHRERELIMKSRQLSEMNKSLRTLSRRRSEDFKVFETRILDNIEELVMPYLGRLKDSPLNVDQRVFLNIVEANLSEISAPFMRQIGEKHNNLTPREVEVANLVRMGNSSKEIAKLLGISKRAVEFHRDSLRNKLGLKKTRKNLRAYLASIR
ncbi:MAG: PAS domain S-box protein [Proteobacteria bacterium]|nr:PAS domain S-box protein [Pseudomonadota bacterium]